MKLKAFLISIIYIVHVSLSAQESSVITLEPTDDTYIYGGVITDHTPGRLKVAPYPVGAAVIMDNLRNSRKYCDAIAREYNSITAENAMKMGSIWQARNRYNFRDVDYLVNFAEENELRVHGHCLIWYKKSSTSMPSFIQELHEKGEMTKDEWKALMKEYITTVVGRYKGRIASWDVVNESITDSGEERTDDIWRANIGFPEYLDWAFQCAHEADPDAILFYNDFGYDYSSAKRDKIDAMIKGMKERGVPIHGMGIQTHTNAVTRTEGVFKSTIADRARRLGIYIHISELDIKCNPDVDPAATQTDALKKKQAAMFNELSAIMANMPKNQQYGISFWAVSDANSSMSKNPDWPYLLDTDYMPKTPAYDYFVKGFDGRYIPWNQVVVNP